MLYYTVFDAPLWKIILVGSENGLTHLHMVTGQGKRQFAVREDWTKNDAMFVDVRKQVLEYFQGRRTQFEVVLDPPGTEFQKRAWQALRDIPYGEVRTYGQQAAALGNPKAARAVGMANSKNPIPLIIPCHRVIGSGGRLTGFAHGIDAKQTLLNLEKNGVHHRHHEE